MAHLFVRVDFEPSDSSLGPGMAELLERISERGSIRQGAAAMGMSYRKAWLLLQHMHQTFGAPVVVTETGGSAGGGARLTDLGTKLLRTFRAIEENVSRAADSEMRALSALVQENAVGRHKTRKTPKA